MIFNLKFLKKCLSDPDEEDADDDNKISPEDIERLEKKLRICL